jgi:hypothetical protein
MRAMPTLADLMQRAAALGLFIATDEPAEESLAEFGGPFALRCAKSGYDVHLGGVGLELLAAQIEQIENEPEFRTGPQR